MKRIAILALLAGLALAAGAQAQTSVRVRGTISGLDGNVLTVKARDSRDLKLELAANLAVSVAKAARFEELKAGDLVGITSTPGADGTPVALEVHYLPPTVPEGQGPWDLQPGSTMTNAAIASTIAATGNRELIVQFKGTTQRIVVPDGVPIVRTVPGTRADLVPGEYVFAVAQAAADGALGIARIQVSKDDVKPPM